MRYTVVLLALLAAACGGAPAGPTEAERREADAAVQQLGPDAWDLGEPVAAARQDVCQEGQRNTKVHEVASACTVGRSWVLPAAAGREGVAEAIERMEGRLDALACEPVGDQSLEVALRYWREGVQREPGMLPAGRFTCGDTRVEVATLSPREDRVTPITLVGDLTGGDVGEPETDPFPTDVEERVADSGQAMLWQVTVTRRYAVRR
jgi:hypothetical protein